MIALIMAGGSGTRFWPSSRKDRPKQFLSIVGDKSMIRLTFERLLPKIKVEDIYIVTAANQVSLVREHLPELQDKNIIIEPFGMNTAPCIALSVAYVRRLYDLKEEMIVLPADHVIMNSELFLKSLDQAHEPAQEGNLVTFGIVPTYPATGYGYIEAGDKYCDGAYKVMQFKEKPDLALAEVFLKQGKFYWNSGMFYWQIEAIYKAFSEIHKEMAELMEQITQQWNKYGETTDISDLYAKMPKLPIDIAIMEKAKQRIVIPVDYGWSDVGSWKALADITPIDSNGNASNTEIYTLNAKDNFIYANKFVSLIGVEHLCVVETDDALLVTSKDKAEDVKAIIDYLKAEHRTSLL